jgi:hypothetical protein
MLYLKSGHAIQQHEDNLFAGKPTPPVYLIDFVYDSAKAAGIDMTHYRRYEPISRMEDQS